MTKVLIVSPREIHEYFTKTYEEWDTQIPVETIDEMWEGLNAGTLSEDTSLVIFSDQYLQDYSDDLATAIATFAPEALVLVLFYDMDNVSHLGGLVSAKARTLGVQQAKYYPINTSDDIGQKIYDAFVEYENNITTTQQQMENALKSELADEVEDDEVEPEVPSTFANAKRGLVIASTSSKGGSGKTTVAICTGSTIYHSSRLAAEAGLREKPLSVCIVDMDTRDGQIGFLLNQSTPTALNIFLEPDREIETIANNLIYDERLGVHALLAPKRARTADYLTPDFYQDLIQKLATMFDVVILDTSVNYLDPLLGKVVLPIADAIMFVTSLSIGSVYGMNRWMDEVTSPKDSGGSGISKEKIGVVVNQSAPDLGIDQELLQHAAAGAQLLTAIPLDTAAVVAASNHNRLSDIILLHEDISPAYYSIVRQLMPHEALVAPLDAASGNNESSSSGRNNTPSKGNTEPSAPKKKKGLFGR